MGKRVYSKTMANNLRKVVKKHIKTLIQDPEHMVAKAAIAALGLDNPTLQEFDDTFTKIAGGPGPHFPFPDANAYYTWASTHNMVQHVRVPFLTINSGDDPVVSSVPMDGGGNSLVVMELTKGGGHIGWFQDNPGHHISRWTTKPVIEWLRLMGRDVVHDPKPRGRPLFIGEDGFLREEGVDRLGCKEIEIECEGLDDGDVGKGKALQPVIDLVYLQLFRKGMRLQ